jgi:rhamnulokinase
VLGGITKEIENKIGYPCTVVLPPTHDTASSVLAVPTMDDVIYISSGTWSLMGIELAQADCSEASFGLNFTNEGGYLHKYRFIKSIMGLWMVQCVKSEFNDKYSYAELCGMASHEGITSVVDCNDVRFFAPKNMTNEIQKYCGETKQQIPETIGEVAAVVYNSLAECYARSAKEIEAVTGKTYERIHIIGGGANADYLNRQTALVSGKTVVSGPIESTAIGNLIVQMLSVGEIPDFKTAKEYISQSFETRTWEAI